MELSKDGIISERQFFEQAYVKHHLEALKK